MANKKKKGIFSKVADGFGKVLKAGAETFTNPIAREAVRPFVNVRSAIDEAVPGGRTGREAVKTPFGDVKPFANLQSLAQGKSVEEQGALKPGEAAMGALEVATAGPEGVGKALVKPGAKLLKGADRLLGASDLLKGSAAKTMEQVLLKGGGTKEIKRIASEIAPELVERGLVKTEKGLRNFAKEGLKQAGEQFDAIGELKGRVKVAPVMKVFATAKEALKKEGKIIDQVGYRALEETEKIISQYGDDMAAETMRGIKQNFDAKIRKAGKGFGLSLSDTDSLSARKIGANAIRELLAKEYPDVAEVNKAFHLFKSLDEVMAATKARKAGQSGIVRKGVGAMIGSKVGGVFGNTGAATGAVVGTQLMDILTSAPLKTLGAKGKSELANILMSAEYSIPKIAEAIKSNAFSALRAGDVIETIKKLGRKTEEEVITDDQEREQRIEELRQRFEQSEPVEQPGSSTDDPERQKRVDELRQRFRDSQLSQ